MGLAEIDAVIVAGGSATRFGGATKPLLRVAGRRVVDRQLAVLRPRFATVWLSSRRGAPLPDLDLPTVEDEIADGGPLAGVAAALAASAATWMLAVAGDMPYLSGPVIDALVECALASSSARLVIPDIDGRLEPLHALYHRDCLPVIRRRLAAGKRKAADLAADVEAARLSRDVLAPLDPGLRFRANLNSPRDLIEG